MAVDDAFSAFVRAQSSALFRTAYLLTGSSAAAEDLVQETLTGLYPKWDRVESADSPLAFVRRCLTNAFLSSTRRRRVLVSMWELPDGWDGRDLSEQVANRELIWRLLGELPERQRAAVVLRYFHDLPDDEIGAHLGCRVGTVRSLISRGTAAMRSRNEVNQLSHPLPEVSR